MRLILMAALVALAGCAAKSPAEPEPRVVRVEVPCRTREVVVPPWAAAGLKAGDSLEVKALLAERRQRIGFERELLAANAGCR